MSVKRIVTTKNKGLVLSVSLTQNNSESDVESDLKRYDQEVLDYVINPEKDYEVVRFKHEPYDGGVEDIILDVDFFNGGYRNIGFTQEELYNFSDGVKNSFYKFDYYDNVGTNKKKRMTKIIPMTLSRDDEPVIVNQERNDINNETKIVTETAKIKYVSAITGLEEVTEITGTTQNPQRIYLIPQINNDFTINNYEVIEGKVGQLGNVGNKADFCSESGNFSLWVRNLTFKVLKDGVDYFVGVRNDPFEIKSENNSGTSVFDPNNIPYSVVTDPFDSYDDNEVVLKEVGEYTLSVDFEYAFDGLPDFNGSSVVENRFWLRDLFFTETLLTATPIGETSGVTSTYDPNVQLNGDDPVTSSNFQDNSFNYSFTTVDTNNFNVFNVGDKITFSIAVTSTSFEFYTAQFRNFTNQTTTISYVNNNNETVNVDILPNETTDIKCVKAFVSFSGRFYYHQDIVGKTVNLLGVDSVDLYNDSDKVIVDDFALDTYDFKIKTIKPMIRSNRYKDSELFNIYYYDDNVDKINIFYVNCRFFNAKNGTIIPLSFEGDEFIKCVLNRNTKTYQYKTMNDIRKTTLKMGVL